MPKIVAKSIQTCFEPILGQMFRKFILRSVRWRLETSKNFKKNPKIFKIPKMPKIVPKSIQTCFERVLGQTFRKKFAQFSMEGRVFENFQKNQKLFKFPKTIKISKMPKIVPKSIQTYFERLLGQILRKLFAQFSTDGRLLENFQKNTKKFKIPKTTKIVPKSIQTCFETILGQIFSKFFLRSVRWRLETSKNFKKIQKFSNFQKCPKSFPKVSKRVLNVFWGKLFQKNFAQFSMEGRVFENFQKNQKVFKISKTFKITKMPKIVAKSIQTCFETILGQMFRKFILRSVRWRLETSKNFKKNPKIFKIPKMPKIVPKSIQTSFERVLGQTFRKIFAQFSMEGRVFENFQKNQKLFKFPKTIKISKNAQNRSQNYPNVF